MSETENKQIIQIPAEKLIDALLHARQFEQHYATQESVNHLKEQMNTRFSQVNDRLEAIEQRFSQVDKQFQQVDKQFQQVDKQFQQVDKHFEQVDKQFQQVDKRFDEMRADNRHLSSKLDRLQWFIVAAALALILKDYLFRSMVGI